MSYTRIKPHPPGLAPSDAPLINLRDRNGASHSGPMPRQAPEPAPPACDDAPRRGSRSGGGGRIRTFELLRGQIYSLLPLTARPPLRPEHRSTRDGPAVSGGARELCESPAFCQRPTCDTKQAAPSAGRIPAQRRSDLRYTFTRDTTGPSHEAQASPSRRSPADARSPARVPVQA